LVGVAGFLSIRGNVPSMSSPYAMVSTVPALWIFELNDGLLTQFALFALASLPLVAGFLISSAHLFQGRDQIPKRSVALLAVLAVLSVACFWSSWSYGIEYQGTAHTVYAAALNTIFVIAALGLLVLNERTPRFSSNLAFHGVVFAWLGWCAFPWLGELI
jgi:hypothetical protein